MRKPHAALPSTQRGATLVIALLILVMIMMYGIPAAMDSMQNERMAGNTRNRDLAFQAAEHALKDAESTIFTSIQTATNLNTNGSFFGGCSSPAAGFRCNGETYPNDAAYWRDTFVWYSDTDQKNCSRRSPPSLTEEPLYAQPCYVVDKMTEGCVADIPSGGSCPANQYRYYYRVTARGVGKDRGAVVILQTMYEFSQ